jgi:hypothetical protein
MAAEPLEPVSIDAVFQKLRDRLEAFEAAFRQGPVGAQQVVDLWERSLELKVESEEFYQFLLNYRTILNGLLWAHYRFIPVFRRPDPQKGTFSKRIRRSDSLK